MENKYYTPEIEEFHITFKYEIKENENWVKSTLDTPQHFQSINWKWIAENLQKVRVKYLDQEDIESLGFKKIDDYSFTTHTGGDGYIIYKFENRYIIAYGTIHDSDNLFIGDIKNKSELKKLLKQLGII